MALLHLLQEHEVLFLDFLGFASAVEQWDEERMESLIAVLAAMADAQSDFDITGEPQDDGSYRITSPAEITTFSDNIFVSYPIVFANADAAVRERLLADWGGMVRQQMQRITAQIALAALDVGLLVRGGLSRGRLYHRGGVVVGEAMVDAYRLERYVAVNARVAVSPRITDGEGIVTDADGTRCLDFFTELMLAADEKYGDALAWARSKLSEIPATTDRLNKNNRQHDAAKWINFGDWFRGKIREWPGSSALDL